MKKKPWIFIAIYCLTLLMTGFVYAWYKNEQHTNIIVQPSPYTLTMEVGLLESSNVDSSDYYDSKSGLILLNGLSKSVASGITSEKITQQPYFIEDFTLNVTLTPTVVSYLRIRIQDEWVVTRTYLQSNYTTTESIVRDEGINGDLVFPYKLVENEDHTCDWYYDKDSGYIYYKAPIEISENEITLNVFSGSNYYSGKVNYIFIDTCNVSLNITVELVQANRINAFWGINQIPSE